METTGPPPGGQIPLLPPPWQEPVGPVTIYVKGLSQHSAQIFVFPTQPLPPSNSYQLLSDVKATALQKLAFEASVIRNQLYGLDMLAADMKQHASEFAADSPSAKGDLISDGQKDWHELLNDAAASLDRLRSKFLPIWGTLNNLAGQEWAKLHSGSGSVQSAPINGVTGGADGLDTNHSSNNQIAQPNNH